MNVCFWLSCKIFVVLILVSSMDDVNAGRIGVATQPCPVFVQCPQEMCCQVGDVVLKTVSTNRTIKFKSHHAYYVYARTLLY